MQTVAPDFMGTEYWDAKKLRLKDDAPDEIKKQAEEYYNDGPGTEAFLKSEYPQYKNPKFNWKWEVVES